jgi:molecular chaperone GrpE
VKSTENTKETNKMKVEDKVGEPETVNKKEKKEKKKKEKDNFEEKYNEVNDKYLRLSAEFDNFRKRTMKERMDLIKSAGEDILLNILPVVDDFERAMKSMEGAKEVDAVRQGVDLIYNKFIEFLRSRGVKEIEAVESEFNTDLHDAVTNIPVQEEEKKGKVVDVIEKGYVLNEKVIRFAKVVVGE